MQAAVRKVISNYVTFSGRASRAELWWWLLALLILYAIAQIIDGTVIAPVIGFETFHEDAMRPLSLIVSLAFFLPNLAVGARRLHDIGKSGWWLLIALIPVIGALVLIYFYIQPSQDGSNQFGQPAPLPTQ